MTTAYTSLLGLALPVTGELSGTWGDTVNNSITSLLDSAIAGTTTLSTDADVTLSNNDGTADTSRQAILLWTAGGTVTRTVIAPALSKIYTVINASSSTQSIKVTGPGPTTGVTIIKGEAAMIAWNGSDFVKVSNTGGSFTTQDLTVTGNTILGDAITDTTTLNAQTRFQSRAILGYANMTGPAGVGSLSTTAPAFLYSGATTYTVTDTSGGTQTHAPIISLGQATITNATTNTIYTNAPTLYIGGAPNASTNVTFTRPYALYLDSGTTASATAVTYTNAATLYIAGAPTAGANVTLTTPYALYVNAGASYLGGGVATFSAGSAALPAITTTGDTNTGIWFPAADTIAFTEGGVESMRIDSSGNLGLGVTPSTAGTYKLLQLPTAGQFGTNGATSFLTANAYLAGAGTWTYASDNVATRYAQDGGVHHWSYAATGLTGAGITFTQAMTLDASGNLGIGTTSPNLGGLTRALTLNTPTAGNYSGVELAGAGTLSARFITNNTGTYFGSQLSIPLIFETNATERARIDSSGNLGLGAAPTTSWPAGRPVIEINGTTTGNLAFNGNNTNGYQIWMNSYYDGSVSRYKYNGFANNCGGGGDGSFFWNLAASGTAGNTVTFTQAMTLDASGNLGIGTTSPAQRLNVATASGNCYARVDRASQSTGQVGYQWGGGTSSTDWLVYLPASSNDLTFFGNSAERMRLDSSGNLGLGVTPSAWGTGFQSVIETKNVGALSASGPYISILANAYYNSSNQYIYTTSNPATHYAQAVGQHQWFNAASGTAGNAITFTQAMTLDASGNLLVGVTSGTSYKLNLKTSSASQSAIGTAGTSGDTAFQAILITKFDNDSTTSQNFIQFQINDGGANCGKITANGANTAAFGSTSDQRVKENIVELPSQLDNIMALRPVEFDYLESYGGGHQIGFIAQEIQQVYPDVISTDDSSEKIMSITGWSKTEARLVKAIQEQQALITQLTARITALEGA